MLRRGKGSNGLPTAYGGGNNGNGYGGNGGYSYNNSGYGGGGGYGNNGSGGGAGFGVSSGYADNGNAASRKRASGKFKKGGSFVLDKFVAAVLAVGLFFFTTLYYRSTANSVLKKLNVNSVQDAVKAMERAEREKSRWQREAQTQAETQRRFKDTVRDLEKENRVLKKAKDELQVQLESQKSDVISKIEGAQLRSRETALVNQVYLLQNATARESRREAVERFGVGPHHVQFDLRFSEQEETQSFTVELAPLHKMPHAVHLFLEQVYHELWDNTWFYLNGPHVLQAGPQDWDDDEEGKALQRFKDTQLDTLAFPEYSRDFPHVPWTLGYTGRPGGPDWYINKVDNTIPHGPGGQFQHDLTEQADPCFGKVTAGHDVLMKVFKSEFYPSNHEFAYFLTQPVEIVKARIMEPILPQGIGIGANKANANRAAGQAKKAPKRPRMIHKENLPKIP